ncbi:MAG: transporter substrate-binding domain-containing protein [Treponema sp.]|nr:transporter substrate-binding domain-containing protein [Treponema sp.]
MKKIALLVAAALLAASLVGCAKKGSNGDNSFVELKSRGVFVRGLDDSFPPMGFRDEKNEIVGFDIDLAKEVAARLGVKFKAQPINWDSKEQELNSGKIDCIWNGLTITEERKKALSFSRPSLNNKQVVVVRADSGYKTLADLKGKRIALQSGSSAEDAVNDSPDFKAGVKELVFLDQNLMALNDLVIGGVDGVVIACIDFYDPRVQDLVQSSLPVVTIDHVFDSRIAVTSNNVKSISGFLPSIAHTEPEGVSKPVLWQPVITGVSRIHWPST